MIYLDSAATSYPKPREVTEAMLAAMREAGGNPGRSAHPLSLAASSVIFRARETAAAFFHAAEPEQVVFFPNATYALNTVLHGICPQKNGKSAHVLLSEMEHNAVVRPLYAMREQCVRYDTYPVFRTRDTVLSEEELLAGIRAGIRPDTVLVCACHASNVCGAVLPIGKIGALCAEYGIPFLADASQSAGVYDIDMEKDHIDYLCAAGHKSLLGPQGSGLLVIGADAKCPQALVQGGNGVASLLPQMPDFLPEALEAGTPSTPCIAGLCAGIEHAEKTGTAAVRASEFAVYRRARELLCALPGIFVVQSGCETGTVLSFVPDEMSCAEMAGRLSARGICVRSGYHCAPLVHRALGTEKTGTVRLSFGWKSTEAEAEAAASAVREILSGK